MTCQIRNGSYQLEIYDDEIPADLQREVYDHLSNSEYCLNFYDHPHSLWNPRTDTLTTPRTLPAQPRLPIAWDLASLKARDPVIFKLWVAIEQVTNEAYVIEGMPEGMNYMTDISPLSSITKPDGSPGTPRSAWRVYGSGNEREPGARTKSIHRDNPFLEQDQWVNIVYFANLEWHPSFYGETLFHGDQAHTGDYTGRFHKDQNRLQPIGDVENVVEPRPGRFMVFDARYLHQLKPVSAYTLPILGVVFRLKRI
jgi:hypothetical protein